jgi:hypothetical protein
MPSGIKTWRFRYVLGGAAGDVRIGRYPEIGVADARDRHFELRRLIERGRDPAVKVAQEREELEKRESSPDGPETISRRSRSAGSRSASVRAPRATGPGSCGASNALSGPPSAIRRSTK